MALKKTRAKARPQPSLSKPQEAALMRVYNAYWDGYIKGDVKAVAKLLDEQYTQVGSAESEVFFSKKDAVKFLRDTIDQVAGKAEMRNRVIRVEPHKEFVLITEQTDLFVLIEGTWAFHSKFRASSLMRKRKDGWKFYHQHSSFPDIRAGEGENISIEKVALENIQLRDAVKRRTVELEQKTHDLKVEATLEHVRARAMAMRNSSELAETSAVLFHQINELGINVIRTSVGILDDPNNAMELWVTTSLENKETVKILDYVNLHIHPVFENIIPARKAKKPYALTVLKGNEVRQYYSTMSTYMAQPKQLSHNPEEFFYSFFFSQGAINVIATQGLTVEECTVMTRVANVFGVIYTRFLDLKKAEEQTREARIEAALERVRAKAMAMHSSRELEDVAFEMRTQLDLLGATELETCAINLYEESKENVLAWGAMRPPESKRKIVGFDFLIPKKGISLIEEMLMAYGSGAEDFLLLLEGAKMMQWLKVLHKVKPDIFAIVEESTNFTSTGVHRAWFYCAFFPGGTLIMMTFTEPDDEPKSLLRRFSQVFGLAYRRFADLKQAEAQAREAQIEAALERVRSRSMAMHKSEELADVITVISEQLRLLNIRFDNVSFARNDESDGADFWISVSGWPKPYRVRVPAIDNPNLNRIIEARAKGMQFHEDILTPDENKAWTEHVFAHNQLDIAPDIKAFMLKSGFARSVAIMPNIMLVIGNYLSKPYHEEVNHIIRRFAAVFDQSYTRFLDLQKAETQAREANLEDSLERVRGKAMGMHNSSDLVSTIKMFYQELELINLKPRRCGVGLLNRNNKLVELSTISQGTDGAIVESAVSLAMEGHPVLDRIYESYLKQQEYHPVLRGNEIKKYNQAIRPQADFPDFPEDAVTFGYFFYVEDHGVYAWTDKELSEDDLKVYRRFTSVLTLTYKRYKELKDAEERARIAVREASLDRVRAEIASMRHADDLQRITPLVWRELGTLGVPFFRCGVLIVNEQTQKADYYLSTPEGQPLAALHLDFNTRLDVVQTALQHWREQKVYIDHWTKEQFIAFARSMMELGQIQTMKSYQGGDQPPEEITLQFVPFTQGMLYVGSKAALSREQLDLMKALADAFSTAYARYEDFTRLEAAKAQVENTLKDLRTTQTQLVQSEKMASLGELTAGIAHEIQNPLNFVNNFSEVSKELLDEMEEELKKGNAADAKQIARNVIENLEKITFHGKRADGIVKSMLQHSRKSTGQKELTDINALCDEYLRLSYHGLRAKDKSFNAKFETVLDPHVGNLNVLPQEIGRVILNLINNAFYAVSEKKKLNQDGYEPTVMVTTKKTGSSIEIRVKDNGTGIPQKALDKIFNPFFTTKPTGQGTGLGLSLSYDIITKGHGGELKVETKDGEGSEFTIQLPTN